MDALRVFGWIVLGLVTVYAVIGSVGFIHGMTKYRKMQQEFEEQKERVIEQIRKARERMTQ